MRDDTKKRILKAALELSHDKDYRSVSRDSIAARIGCTAPLVNYHYKTMARLRRAVMREAVQTRDLVVIAQGLVAGDPHAIRAEESLKREAMEKALA